ncbi:DNA methyltransferase [Janibacter limosus]|uniref:DNA methyltransferase n=1 Tax=Janibacter limosus TaxID=53458 RepID=UPI00082E32EE|nr:DNA methyltransferase [Janibacter limosus]
MTGSTPAKNQLYFGDNLDILQRYVPSESVDLVYLDPPFNSNRNYSVIFNRNGEVPLDASAQIEAFEDTWHWTPLTDEQFAEYQETLPPKVADALTAFHTLLGENDAMAYLVNMAPRLVELHRVLKQTGSLYLHCDPTMSHYLKVLLDAIFDVRNFRNEVIWRRTGSHGKTKRFGPVHDVILYYAKSKEFTWNQPRRPYANGHVENYFIKDDNGWRTNYYGNVLTGSGTRGGLSGKPWRGYDPTAKGRHWAIPSALLEGLEDETEGLDQHEKMDLLAERGRITFGEGAAWPIYQRYITREDGVSVPDIWAYQPYTQGMLFGTDEGIDEDVRWLGTQDAERLGYPTQKPVALLERIIGASSNPGDVVLDPFCGCGTTVDAAQKMDRKWVGIDITYISIDLIVKRLAHTYGDEIREAFETNGIPQDLAAAQAMFTRDAFEFERWAVTLVAAQPNQKQVGDKGIDGVGRFLLDAKGKGKVGRVLVSVKGGKNINPSMVRDLDGTLSAQKAEMGILVTLTPATKGVKDAIAHGGVYTHPANGQVFPRLQHVTIMDLLKGSRPTLPTMLRPYIEAKKQLSQKGEQFGLF